MLQHQPKLVKYKFLSGTYSLFGWLVHIVAGSLKSTADWLDVREKYCSV